MGIRDGNGISVRSSGVVRCNWVSGVSASGKPGIKYYSNHQTGPTDTLLIELNDVVDDFTGIEIHRPVDRYDGQPPPDHVVKNFIIRNNMVKASPPIEVAAEYDAGGFSVEQYDNRPFPPNQAPAADAGLVRTVTDADGDGVEAVTLSGASSWDADGTIMSYAWSEGATALAAGVTPTVPLTVGVHSITLTVTDNDNLTDSDAVTITVADPPPNQAPLAAFGFSCAGLTCYFTDASNDGDGAVVSWSWDLGDGAASTLRNPRHTYAAGGAYTVTLTVADDAGAAGNVSQSLTVAAPNQVPTIFQSRISASSDDAEERASGKVVLGSSDLELVFDKGGDQTVGLRFNAVTIPAGATILDAYVQFEVDEPNTVVTALTIEGEDADDAATFAASSGNISSRPRTVAAVAWSPVTWPAKHEAGLDQRTPNIASVIQEIVGRPGWSSGNSLAVIISGTGERTAESFDGRQSTGAPLLHVEYVPPGS